MLFAQHKKSERIPPTNGRQASFTKPDKDNRSQKYWGLVLDSIPSITKMVKVTHGLATLATVYGKYESMVFIQERRPFAHGRTPYSLQEQHVELARNARLAGRNWFDFDMQFAAKSLGDLLESMDCWTTGTILDSTDIRLVDARFLCQFRLGNILFTASLDNGFHNSKVGSSILVFCTEFRVFH